MRTRMECAHDPARRDEARSLSAALRKTADHPAAGRATTAASRRQRHRADALEADYCEPRLPLRLYDSGLALTLLHLENREPRVPLLTIRASGVVMNL